MIFINVQTYLPISLAFNVTVCSMYYEVPMRWNIEHSLSVGIHNTKIKLTAILSLIFHIIFPS